jgi:flagellar M-ring protein FliF
MPRVERISIAVVVDGIEELGADGKSVWRPRAQSELEQIERLAKSATGFDAKRGDQIEVISMRFVNELRPTDVRDSAPTVRLDRDLLAFGQVAFIGIAALTIILLMIRSIIQGLAPEATGIPTSGRTELLAAVSNDSLASEVPALLGQVTDSSPPVEEATISISNIEGQMRASSIRQLIDLTNRHPDTTLTIIRGWMASESS